MRKIPFLRLVLLTGLFVSVPAVMFAGGGNNNNQGQNQQQSAPFDAGLSLLIGGGIIYALKRAKDNKRRNKIQQGSQSGIDK